MNPDNIKNAGVPDIVSEAEKRINFLKSNEAKIFSLRDTFKEISAFDQFLEMKGGISELLNKAEKIGIKEMGIVFGFFIDPAEFNEEFKRLNSIGDRGVYLPSREDGEGEMADGGDWWSLEKKGDKDVGILLDVWGHGKTAVPQKLFIEKGIRLMQNVPSEKQREAEIKLDEMLEAIETNTTFTRVDVEKEVNGEGKEVKKKIKIKMNGGENQVLIYLPETKEIFYKGLSHKKEIADSIKDMDYLPFLNGKKFEAGLRFGYGFISTSKDSVGELELPVSAQILIGSDGMTDIKNELPGGGDIVGKLREFLENSSGEERLVEYLAKIFKDPEMKAADDLTILEVGA